jgi:spore photoproduct lyase
MNNNSNDNDLFFNTFPSFGINKSREILRLLNEIAKIEHLQIQDILNSLNKKDYDSVKKILLKRRYTKTFDKVPLNSFYLPKYEIDNSLKADLTVDTFNPQNIYYEHNAKLSYPFEKIKTLFPDSKYIEIESLKSFIKSNPFVLKKYNMRSNNLFLVKEKYDFFKKCPCTLGVVNCGYSVMNLGMGCIYDCSYCFLQGYQNVPGIVIPYNIEDYLQDEKIVSSTNGFFNCKRIGSGEFTDSLIFDNITNFSSKIIDYFKTKNDIFFEFKTKSTNIDNLLKNGGAKNIVAAWSVNSTKISAHNEFKTPSIEKRLLAAKECALAGFSTAFHFDPIIYYNNWKQGYKATVDMIFDTVPNDSIKWISLGTLRMPAAQKTIIENRFPDTEILNGEFLLSKDYKLRYDTDLRMTIYKYMLQIIKSKKSKAIVYLCMEDSNVWKTVFEN